LRYNRGCIGVALGKGLHIIRIEAPIIVVDGDRNILIAEIDQDLCCSVSRGLGFAFAQV
jgi:hypothetical protein